MNQENNSSQNPQDQNENIDIDMLSTILTDWELKSDILESSKQEANIPSNKEKNIIFDTNINSIDELLYLLFKNEYDFVALEPFDQWVKILFKKDSILKETRYIKFPTYFNIVMKAKNIAKLQLEDTTKEQKWNGEYVFREKNIDILVKTIPWNFWETLYLKAKLSQLSTQKKAKPKTTITPGKAFGFLGGLLFIALILWWAFITFVIFNAQDPEDVSFFSSLGINLNDINSFLLKITTVIFSITIIIEIIVLVIALFHTLFTKKEQKKKRILWFIASWLLLTLAFATATLWMYLDATIKKLPNWLELSYGLVQIYDNNLLNNSNIWKEGAIIFDTSSIIWPIDIKFDVDYLQKHEQRQWFSVQKFIWDFGDGQKAETQTPDVIHSYTAKWNYKVTLTLEWIDARRPDTWLQPKTVSQTPEISIPYMVNIRQNTLNNGGVTVWFDATDLTNLGDIEWYTQDDLNNPAFLGYHFQPSKVYFEDALIGMKVKNSQRNSFDKIFTIKWNNSDINWEIVVEPSYDNDLEYTFKVENIENTFWDGFIESFTWLIDWAEYKKSADITNQEESSTIKHTFKGYGRFDVRVTMINSSGKSTQLSTSIETVKRIKLVNNIEILAWGEKIEDIRYIERSNEYIANGVTAPNTITFDTKNIRPDNSQYIIQDIKWDVWNDGKIDGEGKKFEYNFNLPWFETVNVIFDLIHRKNENDTATLSQIISFELIEKEFDINFDIKPNSDYAPTLVSFDASKSRVAWENIIKFEYDYGDGSKEERDAINPGHRYLKAWNYTVTLTITTASWKTYSTSKALILKETQSKVTIASSMRKAPVGQEIDFRSTDSTWQIKTYFWDFGDGNTSSDANPSHLYRQPWKYQVMLTVDFTNNNVLNDTLEIEITP